MRALEERAEELAWAAQRRSVERIADAWRDTGALVSASADEILVEARGLRRRWLADPGLRFAGRFER